VGRIRRSPPDRDVATAAPDLKSGILNDYADATANQFSFLLTVLARKLERCRTD